MDSSRYRQGLGPTFVSLRYFNVASADLKAGQVS
jgi:UDP-glucose 4-epimerase